MTELETNILIKGIKNNFDADPLLWTDTNIDPKLYLLTPYFLMRHFLFQPFLLMDDENLGQLTNCIWYFYINHKRLPFIKNINSSISNNFNTFVNLSYLLLNYIHKGSILPKSFINAFLKTHQSLCSAFSSSFTTKHIGFSPVDSNFEPRFSKCFLDGSEGFLSSPSDKQLYSKTRKQLDEDAKKYGLASKLNWTHQGSYYTILGVLGGGFFWSTVEKNVNFRYDVDSRYYSEATFLMTPSLELHSPLFKDGTRFKSKQNMPFPTDNMHQSYIQDLYKQATQLNSQWPKCQGNKFILDGPLSSVGKQYSTDFQLVKNHLHLLNVLSNFRDEQLHGYNAELKESFSVLSHDKKQTNYRLSLVNPQLRLHKGTYIPWTFIDGLIVTKAIDDRIEKLDNPDLAKKAHDDAQAFFDQQMKKNKEHKNFIARNTGGVKNFATIALRRYRDLKKTNRITVLKENNDSTIYFGRSTHGNVEMRKKQMVLASEYAVEFEGGPFLPESNNSPSASTFTNFIEIQKNVYLQATKSSTFCYNPYLKNLSIARLAFRKAILPSNGDWRPLSESDIVKPLVQKQLEELGPEEKRLKSRLQHQSTNHSVSSHKLFSLSKNVVHQVKPEIIEVAVPKTQFINPKKPASNTNLGVNKNIPMINNKRMNNISTYTKPDFGSKYISPYSKATIDSNRLQSSQKKLQIKGENIKPVEKPKISNGYKISNHQLASVQNERIRRKKEMEELKLKRHQEEERLRSIIQQKKNNSK